MKKGTIIAFSFLFAILLTSFVVAQSPDFGTSGVFKPIFELIYSVFAGVTTFLKPVFELLIGAYDSPAIFAGKIFILLVGFSVVFVAISSLPIFGTHRWAVWLIASVLAIAGVRFMPASLVSVTILPTSALMVSVFCIITFAAFFRVVRSFVNPYARRFAWLLFAIVFFILWLMASNQAIFSNSPSLSPGGEELPPFIEVKYGPADASLLPVSQTANLVYLLFAILAVIMAFADGTITRWSKRMDKEKMMTVQKAAIYERNAEKRDEFYRLYMNAVARSGPNSAQARALKTQLDNIDTALDAALK